jgi:hypothetical protein
MADTTEGFISFKIVIFSLWRPPGKGSCKKIIGLLSDQLIPPIYNFGHECFCITLQVQNCTSVSEI